MDGALRLPLRPPRQRTSGRGGPGLPGSNSNRLFQLTDEDTAVAGPSCARNIRDGLQHRLDDAVVDRNFDFGSGSELGLVHLSHGHPLYPELCDRLPQFVQLEWPHDCGDHFHDVDFLVNGPVIRNAMSIPVRVFFRRP